MAGKGGGSWKVAYADFVTAMMAFFLVMWIVGQDKPVKESVASYFRDPYGLKSRNKGSGPLPGGEPQLSVPGLPTRPAKGGKDRTVDEQLRDSIGENPNAPLGRKPSMIVLREGKNTSVGAIIPFSEQAAQLDELGKKRLDQLLPLLLGKSNRVEIRGHSTRRPLPPGGEYRDAWELCYARCLATLEYLTSHGIEPDRIRLSQAGPYEPQTNVADAAAISRNSRVEVFLLSEFAGEAIDETGAVARAGGAPAAHPARFP